MTKLFTLFLAMLLSVACLRSGKGDYQKSRGRFQDPQ